MRRLRFLLVGLVGTAFVAACSLVVDTSGLAGDDGDGGGGGNEAGADGSFDAPVDVPGTDAPLDAPVGPFAARCTDGGLTAPDPALVLYLPFDEGAGTAAVDCSGRGHDGTILGGGTWVNGHAGSALHFDGVQTCVDLGMPADLDLRDAFTVATWIRVDQYAQSSGQARNIIEKSTNASTLGWRVATDDPHVLDLKVGRASGTPYDVLSPVEPLATWLHVATVWVPGVRAETYVGGMLVTPTPANMPTLFPDPIAGVFVGCHGSGSTRTAFLASALDELRVYARALTAPEIAELAR